MLHNIISYLQQHRMFNALLVLGYFVFIVFMHNPLVLLSIYIEQHMGIENYNLLIAVVFFSVLAIFIYFLSGRFVAYKANRKLKTVYLIVTLLLLIIHSRFMFDSNIEVIHSFEFTILAFLLFPFTQRFGAAIFFTLPFMLIDEWYQYTLLYPAYNDYFDLNDLLTDTYGCGLTMLALMISGIEGSRTTAPIYKRPEFIGLVSGVVLILLLVKTGVVAPYMSDSCANTLLVMNERTAPEPFWRAHPTHHILYHVMNPYEGFALVSLLHLFYLGLDSFRKAQ